MLISVLASDFFNTRQGVPSVSWFYAKLNWENQPLAVFSKESQTIPLKIFHHCLNVAFLTENYSLLTINSVNLFCLKTQSLQL